MTALTILLWITTVLAFAASAFSLYRSWTLRAADRRLMALLARAEQMVDDLERKEASARAENQ